MIGSDNSFRTTLYDIIITFILINIRIIKYNSEVPINNAFITFIKINFIII